LGGLFVSTELREKDRSDDVLGGVKGIKVRGESLIAQLSLKGNTEINTKSLDLPGSSGMAFTSKLLVNTMHILPNAYSTIYPPINTEFCGTIDADAKRMARALNFGWANHQSRVNVYIISCLYCIRIL